MGEELLELLGKLGGEGLVVGHNQGGPLHLLHDVGHGKGLAAAGNAQQALAGHPLVHAVGQALHGGRLVSGHSEIGYKLEGTVLWPGVTAVVNLLASLSPFLATRVGRHLPTPSLKLCYTLFHIQA